MFLPVLNCGFKLFLRSRGSHVRPCSKPVPHDSHKKMIINHLVINDILRAGADLRSHLLPSNQLYEDISVFDDPLVESEHPLRNSIPLFGDIARRTQDHPNYPHTEGSLNRRWLAWLRFSESSGIVRECSYN